MKTLHEEEVTSMKMAHKDVMESKDTQKNKFKKTVQKMEDQMHSLKSEHE